MTAPPIIDLSLGEPRYGPPPEARAAAVQAIVRGRSGYLPEAGLPGLREALAEKLTREGNGTIGPDQVVITGGASLGLAATFAALAQPGDRILVPAPGFPLYSLAARSLALESCLYRVDGGDGDEPDWEDLAAACASARLLVWNFPSNPMGAVGRNAWAPRLQALLDANPLLTLVSDEVYADIVFDGAHGAGTRLAGPLGDRCVSVFSFSKAYGMAGLRVGYVCAPGPIAQAVAKAHWSMAMSASTPAQWGALAALRCGKAYRETMMELLRGNRELAGDTLRRYGLPCRDPAAAFFLWLDVSGLDLPATELARRWPSELGVRVAPGPLFDPARGEARVRLSFAVPREELTDALGRIGGWLASLPERRPAAGAGGR